jgi:phage recombination protein Bet
MSENTAVSVLDKETIIKPFGSDDTIKLTINNIKNLIAVKTKSGKTCSDNDAIKFIMMCKARLLNPYEGDAFLIGYDNKDGSASFSLITAHQAFLKRAELHPQYDGMESGVIVEVDGKLEQHEGDFIENGWTLAGGWATVFFKNRSHPMKKRVNLSRFQKSWGIWQDDPAGMIVKCAEADVLRSSFPTMLGGLYMREELNADVQADKVVKPIFAEPPTVTVEALPVAPAPTATAPEPPSKRALHPKPHDTTKAKAETPVDRLRALVKAAGVAEVHWVGFMATIGLADSDDISLSAVALRDEPSIRVCLDQWDEMLAKYKEENP